MSLSQLPMVEYTHEALEDPASQMRLLEIEPGDADNIRCRLRTYDQHAAPPYTAISYTWGDPTDLYSLYIDDRPLTIGRNCKYALWQARLHNFSLVWIDAICINQNDNSEKSFQVGKMFDIYRAASLVAACVGAHDDSSLYLYTHILPRFTITTEEGMDVDSMRLSPVPGVVDTIYIPDNIHLRRIILDFGSRPYWRRLWVVQELYAGVRVNLLCGESIADFRVVLYLTERYSPAPPAFAGKVIEDDAQLPLIHLKHLLLFAPYSLDNMLWTSVGRLGCMDRRDRVYGILGLIRWGPEDTILVPDYDFSPIELFRRLVAHCHGFKYRRELARALGLVREDGSDDGLDAYKDSNPPDSKLVVSEYCDETSVHWIFGVKSGGYGRRLPEEQDLIVRLPEHLAAADLVLYIDNFALAVKLSPAHQSDTYIILGFVPVNVMLYDWVTDLKLKHSWRFAWVTVPWTTNEIVLLTIAPSDDEMRFKWLRDKVLIGGRTMMIEKRYVKLFDDEFVTRIMLMGWDDSKTVQFLERISEPECP